MLFNVTTTERGERTIVSVLGDVDLSTLPELANRISRALTRQGCTELVVTLTDVEFFDPLCYGVLLSGRLRAGRSGRRLLVVVPPGRTRDVMVECGLDQVIELSDELV